MFFRKRHKEPNTGTSGSGHASDEEERYLIDYDMILRGAVTMRRGRQIRQCGVTVDGSTRLVTSGDYVDRETYQALINGGIILPPEKAI